MKRFVFAVAASLVAVAAFAQGANYRIGVINVERLVQESALGKEAFSRVKKLNDQKKEEADKLSKELRDMEQKLADQGTALADDKREALQKSYQEKAIAFKRFQTTRTATSRPRRRRARGASRARLPIINQVGKERGFTLIFNKFQSGLVFADDGVDITDEVLKVFNTTVSVPSAKPAADGAAKSAAPAAKSAAPAPAPTKKP